MPRTIYSSENDVVIEGSALDERLFTPEGDYDAPLTMEDLLQECGLTFEDYQRADYE